jgi:hypothetical protein
VTAISDDIGLTRAMEQDGNPFALKLLRMAIEEVERDEDRKRRKAS